MCRITLGAAYFSTGRLQKAKAEFGDAETLFTRLAEEEPHVLRYKHALAYAKAYLASVHKSAVNLAQAESGYRDAIAIWQALLQKAPEHKAAQAELASCLRSLANFYVTAGRVDEALPLCRQSIELSERLHERFPVIGLCRNFCPQAPFWQQSLSASIRFPAHPYWHKARCQNKWW